MYAMKYEAVRDATPRARDIENDADESSLDSESRIRANAASAAANVVRFYRVNAEAEGKRVNVSEIYQSSFAAGIKVLTKNPRLPLQAAMDGIETIRDGGPGHPLAKVTKLPRKDWPISVRRKRDAEAQQAKQAAAAAPVVQPTCVPLSNILNTSCYAVAPQRTADCSTKLCTQTITAQFFGTPISLTAEYLSSYSGSGIAEFTNGSVRLRVGVNEVEVDDGLADASAEGIADITERYALCFSGNQSWLAQTSSVDISADVFIMQDSQSSLAGSCSPQ